MIIVKSGSFMEDAEASNCACTCHSTMSSTANDMGYDANGCGCACPHETTANESARTFEVRPI